MARQGDTVVIGYGVALIAPLVCCVLVRSMMGISVDPLWLLRDGEAFGMRVLFYPVVEELAFRGVIQGVLLQYTHRRKIFPGLSLANLITSLLFVAIHFVYHPPLWAMAVIVPSLIFGYFRERFGGVIPSVILHAHYNAIFYMTIGR